MSAVSCVLLVSVSSTCFPLVGRADDLDCSPTVVTSSYDVILINNKATTASSGLFSSLSVVVVSESS